MHVMPIGLIGGSASIDLGGDANWSDVELLVQPHQGDSAADAMADRGPIGNAAVLAQGSGATVTDDSAASPVWGAYVDGGGSNHYTYAGVRSPGAGDFTVELLSLQGNFSNGSGWRNDGPNANICGASVAGDSGHAGHFDWYTDDASTTWLYSSSGSVQWNRGSNNAPGGYDTAGTSGYEHLPPKHRAISRIGSNNHFFLNGMLVATTTDSTDWETDWNLFGLLARWSWGSRAYCLASLLGFRYTRGVGRYSTAFVPPLLGFPEKGV